jgi:hypothetical protein
MDDKKKAEKDETPQSYWITAFCSGVIYSCYMIT